MNQSVWSEDRIITELKTFVAASGHMPTSNYLRSIGNSRLSCAVSKHGGWLYFANKLGVPMTPSDTVKGWDGEIKVKSWLEQQGYSVERMTTRAPFDLLLNGCLRVDVKAASFAKYGFSCGWFYRMGKVMTADIVICARMDMDDYYIFPWFRVPKTNLTVSPTGTAHAYYHMNTYVLRLMADMRASEILAFPECVRGGAPKKEAI